MNRDRLHRPARHRTHALLCSLAVAVSLGPVAANAAPAARAIDIRQFAFVPNDITVEPGTRVVWTNRDETPHTVTSRAAPRVFASPGLDTDDRFERVFDDEGDFAYLCTVHPMMTAVVHVRKGDPTARRR